MHLDLRAILPLLDGGNGLALFLRQLRGGGDADNAILVDGGEVSTVGKGDCSQLLKHFFLGDFHPLLTLGLLLLDFGRNLSFIE